MDKIKVNNQVVKMRKHVKRAKLFSINKFTKQLKQLQNKKGNDSQAEKNQRKVMRLLEKIKILKIMKPDFVSKKALSKAKDWNLLLSQKNVPLEDQCLASLANDSEVQKEVENFYAKECHLVEKIPTLLLEWEMKSQIPKSPVKKKKASDIKRQKLEKIAKRKNSNFQGATFPNNVAVDKSFDSPNLVKKKLSQKLKVGVKDTNIKDQNENLGAMEDDTNSNDQLNSESSNNTSGSDNGKQEFFAKAAESKKSLGSKNQAVINKTSRKSVKTSDPKKMHSNNPDVEENDVDGENEDENSDEMEVDLNEYDQFDSESSNNSSNDGSEDFFQKAAKSNSVSKNTPSKNHTHNMQSNKETLSNVDSSGEENSRDSFKNNITDSISTKVESTEDSTTSTQPSIFERLAALANRDGRKPKSKYKSNARNTKAIKVLDLNELQDSELIPIQSSPTHTEELDNPQTVVPKKDSFFLDGDKEIESSDDESDANNHRHSQTKLKFSNFDKSVRGGKFKRNNFTDKPRKSFNSFKDKDFSGNENRFQNKEKEFNRNENRFQSKGKDFNQNRNGFLNKKEEFFNRKENKNQKSIKGGHQLNNVKQFDNKSRKNPQDNSFNQKRENKNSTLNNSFQSKKQSNEKGDKNFNLHPSWEAKNKLKEAAKSGFKGKRIVFD